MKLQGKSAPAIAAMQSLVNDTKKDSYTEPEKKDRVRILNFLGSYRGGRRKTAEAVAAFRQRK